MERYQLNRLILEMSISDKKVLHHIHDFINYSSVKEDYLFNILRLSGHNLFPEI